MKKTVGILLGLALMVVPLAGCDEACGRKDINRYNSDGSIDKCVKEPTPHWSQIRGPR
jgi:hypothetical protein